MNQRILVSLVMHFTVVCLVAPSGCLFLPAIDDDGYVPCSAGDDCGPGRSCAEDVGLCAPPPWNDTTFTERRLLVVQNPSEQAMPAGTAIPVPVGGDGALLSLDDVEADARVTDFDDDSGDWRVVGVYRDLFADRFTIWVPLPRELAAGKSDALAYLEQGTADGGVTVLEDPTATFLLFDDLDAFPDDEDGGDAYLINAPGAASPVVRDGEVSIGENVTVIWRQGFRPPVDVTFRARFNGLTCDEVFVGLTGDDAVGFNPPSAGFFVSADLLTVAEVAPLSTSNPTGLSPPRTFSDQPNATHRFRIQVDGEVIRTLVDDVVFDERRDLRPAFDPEAELFPTIQVGGECSVDIDALWVTPLPATAPPVVTAELPVQLNVTF
jgi:hypothetical protein